MTPTAIQDDLLSFLPTPQGEQASLTPTSPPARPGAHPTDLLDAVADHWLPSRVDDRAAIGAAIAASLAVPIPASRITGHSTASRISLM